MNHRRFWNAEVPMEPKTALAGGIIYENMSGS
jgi:hypothetical protein